MTEVSARPKLETFNVAGDPLLDQGSSMRLVAATDEMWLHLKVYSNGGENGLHAHTDEDHAFVVLQGQATYADEEGAEYVVNRYEGVLVPRGALYRFQSTGEENLVLLRVGSSQRGMGALWDRSGSHGEARPFDAPENLTGGTPPVPIAGRFFGLD